MEQETKQAGWPKNGLGGGSPQSPTVATTKPRHRWRLLGHVLAALFFAATIVASSIFTRTALAADAVQVANQTQWTNAITTANGSSDETTIELTGSFTLPAKTEITGKVRLTGSGTITFNYSSTTDEETSYTFGGPIKVNGGTLTIDSDGVTFSHTDSTGGGLFWIENGGSVVMNAGTIDNGGKETYGSRRFIVVKSGSSFVLNGGTIQNVKIKQNNSLLCVESGAAFRMTGGTFSNIPNEHEAAVTIYGTFDMTGGTFSNCGIKQGDINGGSAVMVRDGGVANVSGGTFTANGSDASSGGAIHVGTGAKLTLGKVKIYSNIAQSGGGLYVDGGTVIMNGAEIYNNQCSRKSGNEYGGGIYVSGGTVTINSGAIHNNTLDTTNSGSRLGSDVYVTSGGSVTGLNNLTTGQPFHETGAYCTDWHTETTSVTHGYGAASVRALGTVSGNSLSAGAFIIGPGNSVTATFVNYDGTELQKSNVTPGNTPSYTGETPTKPSTPQYVYTFSGWSPSLGSITEDTTYTAQFTESANPNLTVYWLIPKSYATRVGYTVDDVIATRVLASSGSSGTTLGAYSTSSYVVVATTEIESGSAPVPPDMTQFAWYNNLLNGTTKTNATQVNSKMRPVWWQKAVLDVVYDSYFNFPEGVADTWYYQPATSSWGSSMPKYDITDNKGAASLPETSTHIYYILGMEEYSDTAKTVSYEYTGTVPTGAPAAPGSSDVEPNAEVTVAAAPTMTGYTFSGWTATNVTPENGKFTMPDTDVTFTGSWTVNTHIITYRYDGDAPDGAEAVPNEVSSYEYGKEYTLLVPAAVEGYTFSGWTVKSPSGVEIQKRDAANPSGARSLLSGLLSGIRLFAASPASTQSNQYFVMPDADVVLEGSWSVNHYNVTYSYTGTVPSGAPTAPTAVDTNYGTAVTVADKPTLTGYTFNGWTTSDVTVTGGSFTMPDKPVTLTGSWTANNNTVTFTYTGDVPAGQTPPAAQTHDYGDTVTVPAAPTAPEGYTFKGWKIGDQDAGTSFAMPDSSVTVTGVWEKNKHDVTYTYTGDVPSGVTAPEKKENVAYGTQVAAAPTPDAVTGYTFQGWDKPDAFAMPDEAVTITGTWKINQYTITFDTDGGSAIGSITQDYGSTVTAPANPTKDGYTFDGWDAEIPTTMPAENTTVKAKWAPTEYTISYTLNDGSVSGNPTTYTIESDTITLINPTREGYTFTGWTGTGLTDPATTVTIPKGSTGNRSYTASWRANTNKVSYQYENAPAGVPALPGDSEPAFGTTVSVAAAPTMEHYTFSGWQTEDVTVANGSFTMPNKPVTFIGSWTPINYTIKFVDEDGTVLQSSQVPYGETPAYSGTTPTKPADLYYTYTFAGWDKEIEPVTGEATYKATYTRTPITRTVTFDSDGGSGVAPQYVTSGDPVPEPADPTKPGYTFKGWTLDGEPYDFSVPVTGDITLVATWEKNPEPATPSTPSTPANPSAPANPAAPTSPAAPAAQAQPSAARPAGALPQLGDVVLPAGALAAAASALLAAGTLTQHRRRPPKPRHMK